MNGEQPRVTAEQWEGFRRTFQALDDMYDWLSMQDPETDIDLIRIIQHKITELLEKINNRFPGII